jgi:hypothetical protein
VGSAMRGLSTALRRGTRGMLCRRIRGGFPELPSPEGGSGPLPHPEGWRFLTGHAPTWVLPFALGEASWYMAAKLPRVRLWIRGRPHRLD